MSLDLTSWAAGIRNAGIRDTSGAYYDINAVVQAEGDPQQDIVEVKGDDQLKTTFVSNIREELTLVANGVTFDAIQAVTGNSYSSSALGQEIPLGTPSEENPPFIEIYGDSSAKNLDLTVVTLRKIWHKVQITSVKVTQQGETEFSMELKGTAYQTDEDIIGGALSPARVSTLKIYS